MTTDATPAGPRLAELGPNAGLIDEMYRLYRENPNAVSAGWREFFADYQPRADVTAPVAPPAAAPAPTPPPPPAKADGTRPPVTLDGEVAAAVAGRVGAHRREHGSESRRSDRNVSAHAARQAARDQPADPEQPARS